MSHLCAQQFDEDGHVFVQLPTGPLYGSGLGVYVPPDSDFYKDPIEQLKVLEAEFMQASEEEIPDAIQNWVSGIRRMGSFQPYNVPSESVEKIWKYCLRAEPGMQRSSLDLFSYVKESDRPRDYGYHLYTLLMEGRFGNEVYTARILIEESFTEEIQQDLLANAVLYIQGPQKRNFGFFLELLDADQLYEVVQGLFWEAPDKIDQGLRTQMTSHFIKEGSDGLRRRLTNETLQLERLPNAILLMGLLQGPIDQDLKMKLVTKSSEEIRKSVRDGDTEEVLLFYKQLSIPSRALLSVDSSELIEPALEQAANSNLDLQSRLDFFITGVFPSLKNEALSEDQYFQALRLRLPEFVGLEVLSVSSWKIRQGQRRWLGRSSRISADYYFYTTIFEPAVKTFEAQELLGSFYKAIEGARSSEDLNFDSQIILESLHSDELRVRALAEEICRRMMSDRSFDQLIEYIRFSDLVSEPGFLLSLILERSRLSRGGYEVVMELMAADDFHGEAAIYYAAQKWAASAEPLVKSSLLRWEKRESDRLAQVQLIAQYIFLNSTIEFWKSLGPEEFAEALKKSRLQDSELRPSIEVLTSILRNSKERVQDETNAWELRLTIARETLEYLRYYKDFLNEDLWLQSLDFANWSYDQLYGVSIDETLLFFFKAAKPQFPDQEPEIQNKIDELFESVRGS